MEPPIYVTPDGPLSSADIVALSRGLIGRTPGARHKANGRRWAVLQSKHSALIVERIAATFQNDDLKQELRKFVSVTLNPAADIVDSVCAVWSQGATRRVTAASEDASDAFSKLVTESGIDAIAPGWNRTGYYEGPVVIIPWIRNGILRHEKLLPHFTNLGFDQRDPMGDPIAAAYLVSDRSDTGARADFAVVDSMSRRYFKAKHGEIIELVDMREDHGLGYFPGSTLRFEDPELDDWWIADRHPRLQSGTVDVGRIFAAMNFVRRAQNKQLLTLIGPRVTAAMGQGVGDPEMPIVQEVPRTAGGGAAADFRIDTLAFDTDPANFMKEIRFVIEAMAESTGVPVRIEAFPGSDAKFDTEYDHHALTEFRNAQTYWARKFEKDLWQASVDMARAMRHELSSKLPSSKDMESFSAEFPPIHRKFADPRQEREWIEFMIKTGAMSVRDVTRRMNPLLSPSEVKALHERNTKENELWWAEVAARNGAVNSTGGAVSAAQKNGSLGGKPAQKPKEDEDQDQEEDSQD